MYAIQWESAENLGPVAFATSASLSVPRLIRWRTGFVSAGTVLVSWSTYATQFPSPDSSWLEMLRHLM